MARTKQTCRRSTRGSSAGSQIYDKNRPRCPKCQAVDCDTIEEILKQKSAAKLKVSTKLETKPLQKQTSGENSINDSPQKATSSDQPSTSTNLMDKQTSPKTHSRIPCKRPLTDASNLVETQSKRLKKNEEDVCGNFIDNHYNKSVLLRKLSEKVDGKEMLQAYKEKRTKETVQEEVSQVLQIESSNSSTITTSPEIVTGFKTVLEGFGQAIPRDVYVKTILESIKDKLKASEVLDILEADQLKEAIPQKFTEKELLDVILKHSSPAIHEKMLEKASNRDIMKQIYLRKSLIASEILLNLILQNGPDKYSNVTKENMKSVLQNKFTAAEFNDLSYAVTKFHLAKHNV